MANPRVYFDITISNKPIGRVVMELFADTTPHTAENFRALCTGEKGVGSSGKLLHYKGSTFHKVYPGSYCMGGDITFGNGVGGESIYGANFSHENYVNKHTGMGILSMVNTAVGSKYNNSQFFICTDKMAPFDGKCVAFGQVVEGIDVVRAMEKIGSVTGKTSEPVVIADCGQLLLQTMPKMLMSPQKSGNELEQVKRLRDSLKRCKEEYEELIEGEDVKRVIEPNKVKDAHDLKVELKELMDMEENMKQCFEAMSELKKQMCLWEEYSKKRSSETQTKIANMKSSILILEAIQHLPYENILSIESAIKKRKTCSQ